MDFFTDKSAQKIAQESFALMLDTCNRMADVAQAAGFKTVLEAIEFAAQAKREPLPADDQAALVTEESALAAIKHVEQSNSHGRARDAIRMLVHVSPTPTAAK